MTHAERLVSVLANVESAMNTEDTTAADLGALLTHGQAHFLTDAADWLREIVAARPPIEPAKQWANATQLRKEVAQRTGAAREFVGRKPQSFFPKRRSR